MKLAGLFGGNSFYKMEDNWQRFRNEVSDPSLMGPAVIPYGEAEHIGGELYYTGYRLEMTTDTIEMSAPILRLNSFFADPLEDLYLMQSRLGFNFYISTYNVPYLNDQPLLRLTDALSELYRNTTTAYDLLRVLEQYEPLVTKKPRGQTRLHTSCAAFVPDHLKNLGFAISKINPHKNYIRIRMAWLFPSSRNGKADYYLPAGTIKLHQKKGDILSTVEFCPKTIESVCAVLQERVMRETEGAVDNLLSSTGRERVYDSFFWSKGVDSPRAKARKKRVEFVANHQELWNDHEKLAAALHEQGLYSKSTVQIQIVWFCRKLIEEAAELLKKADANT